MFSTFRIASSTWLGSVYRTVNVVMVPHLPSLKAVSPASHSDNMEGRMKNEEENNCSTHCMSSPLSSEEGEGRERERGDGDFN